MVANAIQQTMAFDRESTFGGGVADWDSLSANGSVYRCYDVDVSKIQQGKIENKNLKLRAGDNYAQVLGLKANDFGFKAYLHGSAAGAAEGAQAAAIPQDELLYNALGGYLRGYGAGIAAGTAANPTVEDADGDNLAPYTFGFFFDDSAGVGYCRQIASIAEGVGSDTLTMSTGHTLPFTPDAGGADRLYACVEHWCDYDILEDHTHASHTSLAFFFKGKHTEYSVELEGCAVGVEPGPIEQGSLVELRFAGKAASSDLTGITQPDLTSTPAGIPGRVPGSGTATLCYLSVSSVDLAAQTFWGAIEPKFGAKKDPVQGPNGLEGIHGFGLTEDSYDAAGVDITVPFDDAFITAHEADTRYHLLVQIGNTPLNTVFVYYPMLELQSYERVSVGGRQGLKLMMRAIDRGIAQGTLTAAQWNRAQAPFVIGRVA